MIAGRQLRLLTLGGLVTILTVVLVVRDGETPATSPAAPSNAPVAASDTRQASAVADVKLELLEPNQGELEGSVRNPFRFRPRPAPAPPPVSERAAPPPVFTGPPVPAGPPPLPPIPLKFIGLVDAPTSAGRIALLSDGRGNTFQGKEGDIIEGRYRLIRISPETLDLSYVDGRGRQTLRLSGQ